MPDLDRSRFNQPFAGDIHAGIQFRLIVREYRIQSIIETGTFKGYTTRFLASLVPHVLTIEFDSTIDSAHLNTVPNVRKLHMPSPQGIRQAVALAPPPYLFYLDARWNLPTPTPHELESIASLKIKPVIAIPNFKVPDHPTLQFDSYPDWTSDLAHIQPYLEKIYGQEGHLLAFNQPAPTVTQGMLYIAPAPD